MAIARVQSAKVNSAAAAVATIDLVLSGAPTAGNMIVIAVASNSVCAISSSDSITWVSSWRQGTSSTICQLFIGRVYASASATITLVPLSGAAAVAAVAAEYSGTQIRFDHAAAATATSASAASGATTTTSAANELWIGAISHRNTSGATFSAPTNSFTIIDQDKTSLASTSDRSVALLERIVTSSGTANAGATISTSGIWMAQVLTFEEASGGSSGGEVSHVFIG